MSPFTFSFSSSGSIKRWLLCAAVLLIGCSAWASDVSFDGVASGDPTTTTVILWTRAKDAAELTAHTVTVEVATDAGITTGILTATGSADPANDFTLKIDFTGLTAGTKYYYRFKSAGGAMSNVGTFKTAYGASAAVAVKFAFSGDADGKWRPYPSIQDIGSQNLDFFAFLGDTMYENAASTDSAAVPAPDVDLTAAFTALRRKYLENITPQKTNLANSDGTTPSLKALFASQANYTLLDNHELCSNIGTGALKGQFQSGGAPLPFDPKNSANDANTTSSFTNKTAGFMKCQEAYRNYEPIREHIVAAPSDPRTDGTQQMYVAQQWGKNLIFINTDCRSYRDIRMFKSDGSDDTGSRADNPKRTMFGATQLAWLKQNLLAAQSAGTSWKIVTVSDPIDQVAPIGGTLGSVVSPNVDGGKSFIGGYRAERNDLLKFIADNKILNVVFLATDDHLNRVNELRYFPDPTNSPSLSVPVPACFTIVAGPIGASGPELVAGGHTFANLKSLADAYATAQKNANVDPIGLDPNYPGLHNVVREGDAAADTLRQPIDFYSPDTFNYAMLDISANGKTLTVKTMGIDAFNPNIFSGPTSTPPAAAVREILSFQVDASTNSDIGVSTNQTPYLVPLSPGVRTKSIFSVGDTVDGTYRMAGIPDGLGAFDNGDGSFTLLMNHEIGNTLGTSRLHGSKGSFVSKWNIDIASLTVNSVTDLMNTATSVVLWDTTFGAHTYKAGGTKAFSRFCSADLPAQTGLINSGATLGTSNHIFFNGEETAGGIALAHVVDGPDAGKTFELPRLGKCEHENVVVNPFQQDKTVVATLSDTSPTGQVYVYIGTKTNAGLDIDKAGLTNGTLYGIAVTGVSVEDRTSALGASKGVAVPFNLAAIRTTDVSATVLGIESDTDGTLLNSLADLAQVTRFQRPEDGCWDPSHPEDFYFVTTDRLDTVKDGLGTQIGRTRLWRAHFSDLANAQTGGQITLLLDGTEAGNMFDNVTIDQYGHVVLLEDVGNAAHNGKVFYYDIATGSLEMVAGHDTARFGDIGVAATAPFNQDEESSGVIDASSILGDGWFLIVVQAHYSSGQALGAAVPIDSTLVEGGQLLAMYIPTSKPSNGTNAVTGVSSSQTPYVIPVAPGVKTVAIMSAGDSVNNKPDGVTPYRMVGVPDGLGEFDNGDGTFTLTMNHELAFGSNNGTSNGTPNGIARAHGSLGSFVSKWTIEKRTLKVRKVEDLTSSPTNVFLWNSGSSTFGAGTTTAWQRFCSADVPAVSALYNSKTGRGTQERIHMNGEEFDDGRAFAHIITGTNAGKSYELAAMGKFNHENSLACPVEQDKTIVIGTNDKSGGTASGQIYVYVGSKNSTGSLDVDKAGLLNGILYGVSVTGASQVVEDRANGLGTTAAGGVKGVANAYTLAPLGDVSAISGLANGAALVSLADGKKVTKFLRPEDGVWDPKGNGDFYFATTDRLDSVKDGVGVQVGRSRLWRLRFNDILNPEFGGTVTLMLDGTEVGNMFDNLTMDTFGHILITEDVGAAAHNGKILLYDTVNGSLKILAKHDPARFGDVGVGATAPFTNDKETSGIIDASNILGPGWFLFVQQAHPAVFGDVGGGPGVDVEVNEGGQLLAMFVPDAVQPSVSFSTVSQVVSENVGTVTVIAKLSAPVGETVSVPYVVGGTASFSSSLAGGGDHNLANGNITILAGSLTGTKTFSVWNDTVHEGNETITLTMGTPTYVVLGSQTVHTVLIRDNDSAVGSSVANDSVTTNEDTAVTTQNVLTNDAGINGVAPAYAGSTLPTNGTLVDNKDGTFVYTPSANFNGSDSFTYSVSDTQTVFKQTNVPTLISVAGTNTGTVNLPNGGYGSSIAPVPSVNNEFYIMTDRGPNGTALDGAKLFVKPDFSPQIGRFRIEGDGTLTRLYSITLRRADGTPLTGQPIPSPGIGATLESAEDMTGTALLGDAQGLDSEGLVALADGSFWVSDEYGPFLVHFDSTGKTIERISPASAAGRKLPQVLLNRVINKGMEGLAVMPDGVTLVGMMQNALSNPAPVASCAMRIVTFNTSTGATKQYVYLLESNSLGVSEICTINDHEFLALERDGKFPNDTGGAIKNVFKFDISAATDISDANDTLKGTLYGGKTLEELTDTLSNAAAKTTLAANSVVPVTKSLFIDISKFKTIYNHDKMEGMTLINGGKTLIISNDDDFGLDVDTTVGNTTQAQTVKVKKSKAGVVDTSELLFVDLATATVNVSVLPVNDVPSFTKGADQTVEEDSGAKSVSGWATAISAGPANESTQSVSFVVTNDANALFSAQPAVGADGTLTFTSALNANGSATVTVSAKDDGGGTDTSAAQTFTITVTAVNDAPNFTKGADQSVDEDAGAQTVTAWATNISAGPADEAAQTLTFLATNDKNALFSTQPAIASNGTLTYTPASNANGSATVTVSLSDNGDGANTSAVQTFKITVRPVNDPPVVTSEATATPAIAKVGDPIAFSATGTDLETAALTYDWNFGDGATGTGSNASHAYGVPGTFGAIVKITDEGGLSVTSMVKVTIVSSTEAGSGIDTDHDGFSDAVETAAGSSTSNPNDTPLGGAAMQDPTALPDAKLSIKLNFAKPNLDAIGLSCSMLVSAGSLSGKKLTVDVGGVAKSFTLDDSGKFKTGGDSGGVASKGTGARSAKFAVKLTKGSFATALNAVGLKNADLNTDVNVPITVIFDGQVYKKVQTQTYTAKAGKTGSTKDKK